MNEKKARASSRIDALVVALARLVNASTSYLPLLLAAPVLGASVYWFLQQPPAQLKLLDTNKVTLEQQLAAARPVFIAVGAVVLLLLVLHFGLTRRRGIPFATIAQKAGSYLTPLLAVPFVVALTQAGLEKESPKLTLFFGMVIAAIIGVSAYRIGKTTQPLVATSDLAGDVPTPSAEKRRRALDRFGGVLAWACVLAMWAAYGWFFTKLSITNHHALTTRTIDLGLYDNIFYQSAHGRPLACTFLRGGTHVSAHFDPLLVLLSPLYHLYPRAEFILGLQSVWIGSGVIPVYLLAKNQLNSRREGVMLAAVYALHPALHGANMYEFHSLSLAGVPLMWTLFALQTGKLKLYWPMVAVSLLVREDIPLMLSMVGVACLLLPDGKLRGTGALTVLVCFAYFVVVKAFFMPSGVIMSGPEAYSYAYYYAEMIPPKSGIGGMILTLITNPSFVVRHAFEEAKLIYIAKLFLPLLLVPFFTRSWRLTLAYGLAFTLLATRDAVFSPAFQYSTTIIPFAFAATPLGIRMLAEGRLARAYSLNTKRLQRGLVFAALAGSLAISYKFGGFIDNQAFRGGFARVVRTLTKDQQAHYDWMEQAKALIPPKVSLGVTNKIGPHVSNRKDVFLYGQKTVQWVFLDEKELKADRLTRHKHAIEQGRLEEVSRRGTYALFKFVKPKSKSSEAEKQPTAEEELDEDFRDVMGDDPNE